MLKTRMSKGKESELTKQETTETPLYQTGKFRWNCRHKLGGSYTKEMDYNIINENFL